MRWEKSGLERVGESGGFGTKFWWRGKRVAERLTIVEKREAGEAHSTDTYYCRVTIASRMRDNSFNNF